MRRWLDRGLTLVSGACALAACGVLALLLFAVVSRGLPTLSLEFLTEGMRRAGAEGGVAYHVLGTLLLVGTAACVAAPLALGVALTHATFLPAGRWRRGLSVALYVLGGVPSILFGIVGLIVFVHVLGWGKSWLAGGILLGVMILPTVTVSTMERMSAIPQVTLQAATGLGLSRAQVARAVLVPQSFGGLLTGLLIGLARAAGETAPLLFTATVFAGVTVPRGVRESPVLSLPYHVFVLAQDSLDPVAAARVWGTATVLLIVVFGFGAAALPLRLRAHEEARHG